MWFAEPEALVGEQALLDSYRQLLCPEEAAQQQRFMFERHRLQYLVSHALVRTTLSRYGALDPQDWTFRKNDHGRPDVDNAGYQQLIFNLSHTDGLVVCAVTTRHALGVDVEDRQRNTRTAEIADRFFSPSEVSALRRLPQREQRERFFLLWTLKEAYIKARGLGLALPLDKFSFDVDGGDSITIAVEPPIVDDVDAWQFFSFCPNGRHRCSLAVKLVAASRPLRLVARQIVPLRDETCRAFDPF
ncbi:MAG: 4'-phosphopantetheinyl transferase superfamily protein [Deltaproteobacteria bacterium]|nr:4'-phosphopantetheinyl transferase superfamily protein [Deltaproteobacteria bacterium]